MTENAHASVFDARCSKCEESKPSSEFYKGWNKSGLQPWCKECWWWRLASPIRRGS